MIILLCGRDQCGLNAHSMDPDSMRIESWSSVDRPLVSVAVSVGRCCISGRRAVTPSVLYVRDV